MYLPLPHLLKNAFTESILFRLFDNNNKLKTLFGKNVFETYILELFKNTKLYDSVSPEQTLSKGKLSSDVIIKNNNRIIFIECKTTFPRAGIRIFNENDEIFECNHYANSLKQVFNSINTYCNLNKIEKNNCFGIIINLIPNNIASSKIYSYLKTNYNFTENEFLYIESHIKFIPLIDIEELCTYSNKTIDQIMYEWSINESAKYNITIQNTFQNSKSIKGLMVSLSTKVQNASLDFINELAENTIIPKSRL